MEVYSISVRSHAPTLAHACGQRSHPGLTLSSSKAGPCQTHTHPNTQKRTLKHVKGLDIYMNAHKLWHILSEVYAHFDPQYTSMSEESVDIRASVMPALPNAKKQTCAHKALERKREDTQVQTHRYSLESIETSLLFPHNGLILTPGCDM